MTTQVQAPFQIDAKMQELIDEKVAKLNQVFDRITRTDVFFKITEKRHVRREGKMVEIELHVPNTVLYADASADAFEKALAEATEKMRRQLLKYKTQMNGR